MTKLKIFLAATAMALLPFAPATSQEASGASGAGRAAADTSAAGAGPTRATGQATAPDSATLLMANDENMPLVAGKYRANPYLWDLQNITDNMHELYFLRDEGKERFDGDRLVLSANVVQFTRDAEYFLPETKGYTATGFAACPTIKYRSRGWEPFNIEVGGFFLGIAGDDHQLRAKPVVRIEYMPQTWLKIVGGTIYGGINHGMYEQLLDQNHIFTMEQEDGFQVLINHDWGNIALSSDTWLNWENFLEPGEAEQEKFTIGSSNRIKIGDPIAKHLQIPLEVMGTHRGGQFTALQDTALETIFNAMTGLDWQFSSHFRAMALVFGYKNNSNSVYTLSKSGYGIYPALAYTLANFQLSAGYWYGNGFIGTRGSHLFMSVAQFDPYFYKEERNMITGKWIYSHGIFGMEAQAYYDLDENKTDFAFGLYLKFGKEFTLLR